MAWGLGEGQTRRMMRGWIFEGMGAWHGGEMEWVRRLGRAYKVMEAWAFALTRRTVSRDGHLDLMTGSIYTYSFMLHFLSKYVCSIRIFHFPAPNAMSVPEPE